MNGQMRKKSAERGMIALKVMVRNLLKDAHSISVPKNFSFMHMLREHRQ
jgi:hypothetical protein